MRLALVELVRRPRRFLAAGGVFTLVSALLLVNGGILDGLFLGSTGVLRVQDADLVVFATDANASLVRSRLPPDVVERIAGVEGVERAGGLGVSMVGVAVPGEDELADAAVVGYQLADDVPAPPPPGGAWADRRLERDGVDVGDTLLVGLAQVPVRVVGWVDDASYAGQGTLWVEPTTWRMIQDATRPDEPVPEGGFAAVVVEAADDVDADDLAARIDEASGTTETVTVADAVLGIPGVRDQNALYSQLIVTTFLVAGLVVALLFVFLTVERVARYTMLRALGVSVPRLLIGLVVQALVVAVGGFVVAWLLVLIVAEVLPDDVPMELVAARAVFFLVLVLLTAAIGASVSFRRIGRIDPAAAVGGPAV